MRGSLILLASAGWLALAACSPAPESGTPDAVAEEVAPPFGPGADQTEGEAADATVSGEATWIGTDVPETARLIVEVRDVTRADASANLLFKEEFPITGESPAAFSGTVSRFDLIPGGNLVLSARIQDGYAILLASDGDIDIADSGETTAVQVPLLDPEEAARGIPRQMITPAGTDYVCGGEALTIAVEAGAAYVTFGDGMSAMLDKLAGTMGPGETFSNGRFLIEKTGDNVRFGRGRALPQACTPAG